MNNKNPCIDKLTDLEYLEHMIPHHQVAVDMSKLLMPYINDPVILHLCRDIIRKQNYEIVEMSEMNKRISDTICYKSNGIIEKNQTKLDIY